MPYLVVILKTDGTRWQSTQPNAPDLYQLQKAVGGFIETVPHFRALTHDGQSYKRGTCFCNEEGKITGLPVNVQATKAWLDNLGKGPFRYPPVLHGDCIYYAKVPKDAK